MKWNLYEKLMKDFDKSFNYDGIVGERLASRLHAISEIGLTPDGGSRRPGFSKEEQQAKDLVKQWMKQAGLTILEDGAGNVFGRLEGKQPQLPVVLNGSHVDSVPNGGHFDGPLGVLSSLEVVEAWKEQGYQPERSYEVVIFSDEEGARFNNGLTGSRAMTGGVDRDIQEGLVDYDSVTFNEALNDVGLSSEEFYNAERNLEAASHFVEVHIEQGKILEQKGLPAGIVSGIAGPSWLEMTFEGTAGHAGNTPMTERRDPLAAAGEFVSRIHTLPKEVSPTSVATVGKLNVEPNGANVIAGEVNLIVDIRDIYEETRDQLVELVIEQAELISTKYGVTVEDKQTLKVAPVPIAAEFTQLLEQSLSKQRIEPYTLPSGAGHDALIVGHHLPVSMLFVRSKDGISHTPKEWSSLNDCVQTVHVLKDYIETLTKN
ncbi:Zn-dependent hydrolase [Halobacillus sp. A5]|uniref:Zn-dependent hydrolase n=1 Tax=Halobacillus sp. A5 TaxID=2880263 RepID=UPI0020A6BCBC|nr:Zn-dependent hydrolase [Halobacillus sp. A5]MCP3028319.1 Zn-dependent hydrolase [Halobacillus sp. A5]